MILYYVHDPMCSWCWAFRPVLKQLVSQLPSNITVKKILGGLAPDTEEVMPEEMRLSIQGNWQRIQQQIPNTEFNYDFWTQSTPRRSTYLACRAVIAADYFDKYDAMLLAIQQAYYLDAKNPSDASVLIALADDLSMDSVDFESKLFSVKVQQALEKEIDFSRSIGVSSFPELVLENDDGQRWDIPIDYNNAQNMLKTIRLFN